MTEQLTLFAGDSLVSHSVLPGSEKAQMMTATSGQLCLASSRNTSRVGLLEKMLLVSSAWRSTTCLLTWRVRVTDANHLLFQLAPSTPLIEGTEFGLWHTPKALMIEEDPESFIKRMGDRSDKCAPNLAVQVKHKRLWPTPRVFMHKDSTTDRGKGNLGEVVGGKLNPMWVEWLMGFPEGWTDLNHSETQSSRKYPKF